MIHCSCLRLPLHRKRTIEWCNAGKNNNLKDCGPCRGRLVAYHSDSKSEGCRFDAPPRTIVNSSNLFSLAGKSALVTGCSRGIGKAMAIGLAHAGADIIGVSATLTDNSDAGIEIRALARKFTAYQCDFSDRASVVSFAKRVISDHPKIDILVNNAGTILRKPAAELTQTLAIRNLLSQIRNRINHPPRLCAQADTVPSTCISPPSSAQSPHTYEPNLGYSPSHIF